MRLCIHNLYISELNPLSDSIGYMHFFFYRKYSINNEKFSLQTNANVLGIFFLVFRFLFLNAVELESCFFFV